MTYYRLYKLHRGHFVGFQEFDAPDDDAARAEALRLNGEDRSELWCGNRLICAFGPRDEDVEKPDA